MGIRPKMINLNEVRYRKALEKILEEGGTYDDLSKTNPEDYGLPGWVWQSDFHREKDKAELIGEVINKHFANPDDPLNLYGRPWLW